MEQIIQQTDTPEEQSDDRWFYCSIFLVIVVCILQIQRQMDQQKKEKLKKLKKLVKAEDQKQIQAQKDKEI